MFKKKSSDSVFQAAGSDGEPKLSKGYVPKFKILLVNGDELGVDWSGVETELEGKMLDKPLQDIVIDPFLKNLKAHLKNKNLVVVSLTINDHFVPIAAGKGMGAQRSAADFATEACSDGMFRPCIIKLEVADAKAAKQVQKAALAEGHTFRVTIGSLSGEAKLSSKWLQRPVKKGVVMTFLTLHNKESGQKCTLADVVSLKIEAIDGSSPVEEINGLGAVVRTLDGPSSNIMRDGGTHVTLFVREGAGAANSKGLLKGVSPTGSTVRRSKSVNIGEVRRSPWPAARPPASSCLLRPAPGLHKRSTSLRPGPTVATSAARSRCSRAKTPRHHAGRWPSARTSSAP